MKLFQIIDLIGMALILVSVGWELFFTTKIDAIEADIRWLSLNDKLQQLREGLRTLQQHFDYKVGEIKTGLTVHGDPLAPGWNPAPHDKDLERVGRQATVLRSIKITLFALGSLLAVAAKYLEYSSHSEVNEAAPSPPSSGALKKE